MKDIYSYCSENLRRHGVDKFQCVLTTTTMTEMCLDGAEMSLLRSTQNSTLALMMIKDSRKGSITVNRFDEESLDRAINDLLELSQTSPPDEAYDISPHQPAQEFDLGPSQPDIDRMYALLKQFAATVTPQFPAVRLAETIFSHTLTERHFRNSNGVDLLSRHGAYGLVSLFSAKVGAKTSSFNYSQVTLADLERALLDCGSFARLLGQAAEQLDARPMPGKFVGDIIITPDCLGPMLEYYIDAYLGDRALITGTSLLKDRLGEQVASPKLTLSSEPRSAALADGYAITSDGFVAENTTILSDGVLQSFMLSLYGANKTKRQRAKNSGSCLVVAPGDKSLDELIANTKRGLLVSRYSGGNPSANGDFSGVAKNSYYIEDGELRYPVSETMIAGNLAELLKNIVDISAERINFGGAILPYVAASGVTISGRG